MDVFDMKPEQATHCICLICWQFQRSTIVEREPHFRYGPRDQSRGDR